MLENGFNTTVLCKVPCTELILDHAVLDQGLWSDDSGDSSSNSSQAAVALASEPGLEGVLNPDSENHLVSTPPLLLVAACRFMKAPDNRLVWVPLLNHLTDDWRTHELTDVSILVAKLLFRHDVLRQSVVSLRELLGVIDVGVHDMSFCVPDSNISVCDVSSKLTQPVHGQQYGCAMGFSRTRQFWS